MKNRQRGFTLLEMLMVIAIMMVLAMIAFQEATLRAEQEQARNLGGQLLKFNNAVRDYVSYYAGSSTYASQAGTKTGINWLKSTTCGGQIPTNVAAEGFLSCDFLEDTNQLTSFGRLNFTTVVTAPEKNILKTKTTMSQLLVAKKPRGDLSGLAAIVAGSASELNFTPAIRTTDGTARYCVSETGSQCAGSAGRILLFTSNDGSNDTWLRTDGSNTMNNNISFLTGNPDESREIKNISKLYNVDGAFLTLGNKTGDLPTFLDKGVVVDSDAEIMGTLYANKMIDRDDKNFYVDPSSESRFNTLTTTGNVTVGGDVIAAGNVIGKQFQDADDKSYLVDPNGTSNLNTVAMATLNGTGADKTIAIDAKANIDNLQVNIGSNGATTYVHLKDLLPTYVAKDAFAWAQGDGAIQQPTCTNGTPKIVLSPMNMESSDKYNFAYTWSNPVGSTATTQSTTVTVDGTTSGRSFAYAQNLGSSWNIIMGTSNGTKGSGYVLAQTFCVYN